MGRSVELSGFCGVVADRSKVLKVQSGCGVVWESERVKADEKKGHLSDGDGRTSVRANRKRGVFFVPTRQHASLHLSGRQGL